MRFLIGRYGSGKSFLIQLIRGYAVERGFLTADADLSPERRLYGRGGEGVDTAKLQFKTRIQDPELHAQLISAAELLKDSHEPGSNSRYARAMARLLDALAIIAEKYPLPETEHKRGSLEGDARIKRTIDYISNNVTGPLTLDALAAEIGISKFHLSREFKRMTGLTIFDFIILLRLKLARRLMREGLSVSESAFSAGFENLSYFSRKFREVNGQLPSEYAAKYSSKNAKRRKVEQPR